jgi:chemotaxis protein methyltransferase CheR
MKPSALQMSQEEYLLFNELISSQFGISYPEHKKEVLELRLRPRLQSLRLDRFLDYYLLIHCDPQAERPRLAELITNNETFFFRETHQFEALFDEALDPLRESAALSGTPGTLRLLCAGCSSGEEPYTLGIHARHNFVRLAGTRVTIDAFDLDASRVELARRGEYGRGSLRAATPEQVQRYFSTNGSTGSTHWTLKPLFKNGVQFAWGNILDLSTYRPERPYDAVFCRNVLIYFSEPALHRAIHHFAEVLRPGGLLFLGHSESIIGLSERFETVRFSRAIAYRKVGS